MQLLSLTASTGPSGLAVMSNYLFSTALVMLVVMTLVYLWYTIGSARLAKTLVVERPGTQSVRSKQAVAKAAVGVAGGSVTTLVKADSSDDRNNRDSRDVVLHEQADGERPIALNRSLISIGRVGTIVGWFAVFMFFLSLLFRTIVEQHAPWSNLYEFSLSFTTALLLCYLIFEARFHERVRAWGLYVCALALVIVGIAYNLINSSPQLYPRCKISPY